MTDKPIKRPWRLWTNQLADVWRVIGIIAAALTFIGLLGDKGWLFEIADVFRVQYAIALFFGIVIFLAARRWIMFGLSLIAFVVNCCILTPFFLPVNPSVATNGQHVRLLQINLNSNNRQSNAVINLVRKLSPDVISFEEVDPFWQTALQENLPQYPFRQIVVQADNFGIAIFSKLPLEELTVVPLGLARVPAVSAVVRVGDKTFRLLALHVLPPRCLRYFEDRTREYNEIVALLADETRPVVIAGDLNSPPWSYYFRELCQAAKLTDSEWGRGIQATWPTNCAFLLIPIDHLLTRGEVFVVDRFVTSPIGSDHYPVCADLSR